ncbi:Nuclear pore complex protein NUP93A-like protein [Drosera capensis]
MVLIRRNLDQLETLSKKLKAKSLRSEDPSQSIAATRLLAREGINAEQLARDLNDYLSVEGLNSSGALTDPMTTYEDVFPAEAATVEEYLQQNPRIRIS